MMNKNCKVFIVILAVIKRVIYYSLKMISAETRHRLGELLGAVAENEKAVEITR